MWLAIFVTLVAAAGNNIGKALQKQATKPLPKLSLRREVVYQYLASRTWVAGVLTDILGALLMIVAFALAPVSVVQPVSAMGLVFLMIFSHFYLHEKLSAPEWAAAGVASIGILGLGATSDPDHADHSHVSAQYILTRFAFLAALLGAECWVRQRWYLGGVLSAHRISLPSPHVDALLCGAEAGACFGLSAASCRTGFLLGAKLSWWWVPAGLIGSVFLTTTGFVLQTRGLKTGNTVVVCTVAAATSMISGIVVGLVALQEKVPTEGHMQVIRVSSWLLILGGVTSLASSSGGGLGYVLKRVVPQRYAYKSVKLLPSFNDVMPGPEDNLPLYYSPTAAALKSPAKS